MTPTATAAPAWHIRRARDALRAGGIVAYPTEAVYGLGCDPEDAAAVERVLALKGRPAGKGLILIAADLAQLTPYLGSMTAERWEEVVATWPGPVTWLVPAAPGVPRRLTGDHGTLAVRVTAHPVAAALARAFGGALVSTSANPAGRPPARDPVAVRRYFGEQLDSVVPGPVNRDARPTAIRDAATGEVVRPG